MTEWNKESIQALLDKNPAAVTRAIVAIYNLQTFDEQNSGYTVHTNGVGFSKFDAEFMTSLAQQIKSGRTLSERQLAIGRNKVKRYWRQLVSIANERAAKSVTADAPVLDSHTGDYGNPAGTVCTCENYDGEMLCPKCAVDEASRRFDERRRALYASW